MSKYAGAVNNCTTDLPFLTSAFIYGAFKTTIVGQNALQ